MPRHLSLTDHLRTLLARCRSPFRSRSLDRDLDEELLSHIDLATQEHLALGMSTREARTAALRSFGGLTQTRETYRNQRGLPLLESLLRDLRQAFRQLHRAPGFALTAILTLALGLGANTAIFSLINALLLRPLPVPHADQLVVLSTIRSDSTEGGSYSFCSPFLRALEHHHEALQSIAGYADRTLQLHEASGNTQIQGLLVSGQYFSALETAPMLGRYLTPEDDREGSPSGYPVVLSENFWATRYNRAPNVLGTKLVISAVPFTIVGVMPRQFIGADPLSRPNLYLPMSAEPVIDAPYSNIAGGFHNWWLSIIARRNPGVSLEQTNASLQAVSNAILAESIPDAGWIKDAQTYHFRFAADPGSKGFNYLRTTFQKPLYVIFALCGAVLLLACLNLASLLMARAAARERELATRLALGASRRRLIQQLLIESLLIAAIGTTVGLAFTPLVSHGLSSLMLSRDRFSVIDTTFDLPVFAFAAAIAVVATLVTGLVPALRATRRDLNEQIKSGSQNHSTREQRMLPRVLMGSEVALALSLVVGAGLLASSLNRLYKTGLGFEPHGLANLELDMSKQPLEGDALLHWYQSFGDALSHLPGVQDVSFQKFALLSGGSWTNTLKSSTIPREQSLHMNGVAPGYFHTMRIPFLEGRDFRWQDSKASGAKIILNQAGAELLLPNQNPIGKRVSDDQSQYEVIAVVGNVTYESIRKPAPPTGYVPITQDLGIKESYSALVRINGSPTPLAIGARSLTAQMAPEIPVPIMTTMSSTLDASITSERMMAMLSIFFAACALLVTAIGLYGTLAYSTARRTSEIGIRIALGSQRLQVVTLIFRENALIALTGSLAGLAAAWAASRVLASFLYSTSIHDPWIMLAATLTLLAIASAASLLPAIRAARINPVEALRSE